MTKILSEATAALLAPIQLSSQDRMSVRLDEAGEQFIVDIYAVDRSTGDRRAPSRNAAGTFVQRIPERKELDAAGPADRYSFGATDTTCLIINAVWDLDHVTFTEEADMLFTSLLKFNRVGDLVAETYADYRERLELELDLRDAASTCNTTDAKGWEALLTGYGPQLDVGDWQVHPDHPLSQYQRVALHNVMRSTGYALFMEQGTGKTAVTIAAICNQARIHKTRQEALVAAGKQTKAKPFYALVVCPKNVRTNWLHEFGKFTTEVGNVTILRGNELDHAGQMVEAVKVDDDCAFSVVVCSYETLCRRWDSMLKIVPWHTAVMDESHYIKWQGTKRWKFAQLLRDKCVSTLCLTGTPITQTALDLFTQLEFLGRGASGFQDWKAFKRFYGVWEKGKRRGVDTLVGLQNMALLKERLARRAFIVKKEEVLPDLPTISYDIIECGMGKEQQAAYEQVALGVMEEIEQELDRAEAEGRTVAIQNILVKMLRMAQVAAGFQAFPAVYDEVTGDELVPAKVVKFANVPKLDELVEAIKATGDDEKCVVWCSFVPAIEMIKDRLAAEGITCVDYYGGTNDRLREEAKWRFNNQSAKECKVFLGNPAAGGTGVNLLGYNPDTEVEQETDATHTFYYAQGWSSGHRLQSEARNHRRGARRQVACHDLHCVGSIDQEIYDRVNSKRAMALEVADIRDILDAVRNGIEVTKQAD